VDAVEATRLKTMLRDERAASVNDRDARAASARTHDVTLVERMTCLARAPEEIPIDAARRFGNLEIVEVDTGSALDVLAFDRDHERALGAELRPDEPSEVDRGVFARREPFEPRPNLVVGPHEWSIRP